MDTIINFDDTFHQPAQFLVENTDLLPRGRALDVAMGSGRNTIYLAKMGFQVEGVDTALVDSSSDKHQEGGKRNE